MWVLHIPCPPPAAMPRTLALVAVARCRLGIVNQFLDDLTEQLQENESALAQGLHRVNDDLALQVEALLVELMDQGRATQLVEDSNILVEVLLHELPLVQLLAHDSADSLDEATAVGVLHLHLLLQVVVHVGVHEVVDEQRLELVVMLNALVLAAEMRPLLLLAHLVHHAETAKMVLKHERVVAVVQVHCGDLLSWNQVSGRLVPHLEPLSWIP